jgi:hypothetical protein
MVDVLRIGSTITTPLGLLGLIAALGYYFYSKALSQNNFSKLTLLLSFPMLECLVLCTRMHGILGRGQ